MMKRKNFKALSSGLVLALASCLPAVAAGPDGASLATAHSFGVLPYRSIDLSAGKEEMVSQLNLRRGQLSQELDAAADAGAIKPGTLVQIRRRLATIGDAQAQYQASGVLSADQAATINRQLAALTAFMQTSILNRNTDIAEQPQEPLDQMADQVARRMRNALAQKQISQSQFDRLNLRLQTARADILRRTNEHIIINGPTEAMLSRELSNIDRRIDEAIATSPRGLWF